MSANSDFGALVIAAPELVPVLRSEGVSECYPIGEYEIDGCAVLVDADWTARHAADGDVLIVALDGDGESAELLAEDVARRLRRPIQLLLVEGAADLRPAVHLGLLDAAEIVEPPPVPAPALPTFPVAALGPRFARYVRAVATAYQVPVDMVAMLALATLAAVVAKRFALRIRDGWIEALTLYVLVAMLPGERKTRTLAELTGGLIEWEHKRAQELEPEIRRKKREYDGAAARVKALTAKLASAKTSTAAEPLRKELDDAYRELDTIAVPVAPRVRIDDATPEALGRVLAENGGRIAALASEGGLFESLAGRYSDGVPNLDLVLKGWDGAEPWMRDRVGEHRSVRSPIITLGLCVQPDVLRGLAAKRGFRGRGLIGRFIYSLPVSRMGSREIEPPPVPAELRNWWRKLLLGFLDLPDECDGGGEIVTREIRLAADARETLLDFARELEPRLGPDGDLRAMSDWTGKLVGTTARVSGLLHVAGGPLALDREVSASAMRSAVEIARYLAPHARAALELMGELVNESCLSVESRELVEWIRRRGGETSSRELAHNGPRHYRSRGAAEAALDELFAAKVGEWFFAERTAGAPGRQGRRFRLFAATARTVPGSEAGDTGDGDEMLAGGHAKPDSVAVAAVAALSSTLRRKQWRAAEEVVR